MNADKMSVKIDHTTHVKDRAVPPSRGRKALRDVVSKFQTNCGWRRGRGENIRHFQSVVHVRQM